MGGLVILATMFIDNSLMKLLMGSLTGVVSYYILTAYVFKLGTAQKIINYRKII